MAGTELPERRVDGTNVGTREALLPDTAADSRERLLATIRARRASIEAYIRKKAPASARLTTISIVSSAIVAGLTAGPALGGTSFAETVQAGANLERSDSVWRVLCFAALAVSITAAISTNLSKRPELTTDLAAARQAGAVLERLQTRLEYSASDNVEVVQEAVREYGDVVAGITFIPEVAGHPGAATTAADRHRPGLAQAVTAAIAVLATLLLLATLVGYGMGLVRSQSDYPGSGPTPAPTPTAAATASSSPAPSSSPDRRAAATGVFAGRTEATPPWPSSPEVGAHPPTSVTVTGSRPGWTDRSSVTGWS